jgi:hypothetical protein
MKRFLSLLIILLATGAPDEHPNDIPRIAGE